MSTTQQAKELSLVTQINMASVAKWLGHWLMVQRVRGRFPDHPECSEINFSGLSIRCGWFIRIEVVLNLTT